MDNQSLQAIYFHDFKHDHIADIFKEIFVEKLYDPYMVSGGTYVDCGAHVGLFSLYAQTWASKIYALEPSYEHFDALQHMVIFNHMDKVIPINAALSDKNGDAEFHHNFNTTMYSLEEEVQSEGLGTETVRVLDTKTLFEENNIKEVDFFKLDTEGHEFKILSSKAFGEYAPRIKRIAVEYHNWTHTNPEQLIHLLTDLGYKVKQLQTQAVVYIATRS